MAPVTATSAGIARQIIDDPALISLLERLSAFDAADHDAANDATDDDGDEVMADVGGPRQAARTNPSKSPPLDMNGLVEELGKCPRWRFQEQVSPTVT